MSVVYPTDPAVLGKMSEEEWDALLDTLATARISAPRRIVRLVVGRDCGTLRERILWDHEQGMRQCDISRKHQCDQTYVSLIVRGKR